MATKKPTLQQRVATLEKVVADLLKKVEKNGEVKKTDWEASAKIFPPNDAIMKQIHEEGRKIREADRRRARSR